MTTSVLIISEHQLLTALLEQLFRSQPDRFQCLGSLPNLEDNLGQVLHVQPDIILFDAAVGSEDLLQSLPKLHESGSNSKVLIFGYKDDAIELEEVLLMGVRGVLDNSVSPDHMLNAIEKVNEGQVWLDRTTTARVFVELSRRKNREADDPVIKAVSSLTERERMLVATVAKNSDVPRKVLADMLSISDSTLRNHLSVIYSKLGVSSRGGLVAYAIRNGLTS